MVQVMMSATLGCMCQEILCGYTVIILETLEQQEYQKDTQAEEDGLFGVL